MKYVIAIVAILVAAAPVHAQPGISQPFSQAGGPFIGEWVAHKEKVVVNADGSGSEVSNYGTMTFQLVDVQPQGPTAYGNVVSGGQRGAYVTIQLVDNGNGMRFSWGGGDNGFPFCKIVNGQRANNGYDCGA